MSKSINESYQQTRKQVFLLHFAGGSCCSFDFFKQTISANFEWYPLELPGRGKRYDETLVRKKKETVDDYVRQIKVLRNNMPYLIFGHSMGAILGLSVAKQMESFGDPPLYLLVSGSPGPGLSEMDYGTGNEKKLYLLNDEELKQELRKLGGTPEEVLTNRDLYDFFTPIIRADFEVLQTDNYSEQGIVTKFPIHAFMGSEEKFKEKIGNWSQFTDADFTYEILRGDHFFLRNHHERIALTIKNFLHLTELKR